MKPSSVDNVFEPAPGRIFVFGSNLAGVHGAGAASYAYRFQGAEWEVGEGLAGDSYAIPTKGHQIQTLPLEEVKKHVAKFLEFAANNMDLDFFVTRIGCGLAGFQDSEIAPLFQNAPPNCELPPKWGKQEATLTTIIDGFFGPYRYLSNFWYADVDLYGVIYPTVEHAYQSAKSEDPAYKKAIIEAKTPREAKDLGKKAVLRPDWEAVKVDFMRYLVWNKFSTNEDLKKRLLSTNNVPLVEGNTWGDTFWGVCNGVGHNWLGHLLMETRTKLRSMPGD